MDKTRLNVKLGSTFETISGTKRLRSAKSVPLSLKDFYYNATPEAPRMLVQVRTRKTLRAIFQEFQPEDRIIAF
jgi:hypothetical protein